MKKIITIFAFLFNLLFITSFAQNSNEILKKAYQKCQSIKNGHYKMEEIIKFSNQDTIITEYDCTFQKIKNDPFFSSKFNNKKFVDNSLVSEFVYTGNILVWMNPSDMTAEIIPTNKWADQIEKLKNNFMFFSPFTNEFSYPLPDEPALSSSEVKIKMLENETVNGFNCYLFQINIEYIKPPDENFKILKNEKYFWIKMDDSLPIKFSEEYNTEVNTDTLKSFRSLSVKEFEINSIIDTTLFKLSTIPLNYKQKDYIPKVDSKLLESGTKAPEWTLKSINNEKFSLSNLKGKLVLLDFFYKACVPCAKALPHLQKLYEKYKDKGLIIIGVDPFDSLNTSSEVTFNSNLINNTLNKKDDGLISFLNKRGINYPVLLGGIEVAKNYKVSGYPTTYFIDENGIIISSEIGFSDGVEKKYEKIIKEHLKLD